MENSKIIWTKTDEAPAMATYSLLPIVKAFLNKSNISVDIQDISLASRVLSLFPEKLKPEQRVDDGLENLGKLVNSPSANIIKLPNISASIPQLKECIKELQDKGYNIPNYLDEPKTKEEEQIELKYKHALGSSVNPVLRQGNSDRRAPNCVKNYVKKFPHKMGEWSKDSKSHVASMSGGDFRASEISITLKEDTTVKITFHHKDGSSKVLQESIALKKGDIIDASFMSIKSLNKFLKEEIEDAKNKDVLFSLHVKGTMMKISDPIIFGYCVKEYYKEVIEKHKSVLKELEINFNNGIGDLYAKIKKLPQETQKEIIKDIQDVYKERPKIAMVDSEKGITNLHSPSNVIVDASMAAAIRGGGKMWDEDGKEKDTKFTIPDSTYAPLYDETIKDCIQNGQLNPSTIGTVANVGLMAGKAEEYGSHLNTFEAMDDGAISVSDANGNTIFSQDVEYGDIWRMTTTKEIAIQDWIKLAIVRAKATKWKTIFWLDDDRSHTKELIKKVDYYLENNHDKSLDIEIMNITKATKTSIQRMRKGEDTISVTGNVLRDYNTDLYPILELGTSAKMLSIVPLINGGWLFETGAGGSAPKHVKQLQKSNYLRWDSVGEFLALVPSLEKISLGGNTKARILSDTLDKAIELILSNHKSPQRKLKSIDNRGSHFYLALYWAKELAEQTSDNELSDYFKDIEKQLTQNENIIVDELLSVQARPANLEGYYMPDFNAITSIMRPSESFNKIIDSMLEK